MPDRHSIDDIGVLAMASTDLMPAPQSIIDAITPYSVALFASDRKDGSHPYFAGSATLVTAGGRTFILTARHVWTEMLVKAATIGFPYRDLEGQVFLLKREIFTPHLPPLRSAPYDPDFCFIEIPQELIPRMDAFSRIRYNLQRQRPTRLSHPDILLATEYTVTGAPGLLATASAEAIDYKHYCYTLPQGTRSGAGYRSLEFPIVCHAKDVPSSFRGVSGGGLWRVLTNPTAEIPDYYLAGVAYQQSAVVEGVRSLLFIGIDRIAEETEELLHEKIWTPSNLTDCAG